MVVFRGDGKKDGVESEHARGRVGCVRLHTTYRVGSGSSEARRGETRAVFTYARMKDIVHIFRWIDCFIGVDMSNHLRTSLTKTVKTMARSLLQTIVDMEISDQVKKFHFISPVSSLSAECTASDALQYNNHRTTALSFFQSSKSYLATPVCCCCCCRCCCCGGGWVCCGLGLPCTTPPGLCTPPLCIPAPGTPPELPSRCIGGCCGVWLRLGGLV